MSPKDLDEWVASIWPACATQPALVEQIIRAAYPAVRCAVLRFTSLDGAALRTEVQLGIWRAITSFDGNGSFFVRAVGKARGYCASAVIERTVPIVWPGHAPKNWGGLTAPHTAGWLARRRADLVVASALTHVSAIEGRQDPNFALEDLENRLRLLRADLRSAFLAMGVEGLTLPEAAKRVGMSRKRFCDHLRVLREVSRLSCTDQAVWLRAQANRLRRQAVKGGKRWIALAEDFERTAQELA